MYQKIALVSLFVIAFTLRLYRLDNPIADWHSWRQADTAAVTRNFVQEGYTPFFPKFDTLNPLNDPVQPNPNRYFFAEFPLYNTLHVVAYETFKLLPIHITIPRFFSFSGTLEEWGRLVSIFAASLTAVALFFLVKEYSSRRVALIAAALFAILPYNIFYGRVIMPDPLHIFLSVLSLYLVTKWVQSNNIFLAILAGVVYAGVLLTKPYGLVLLLPILYLIVFRWKHLFFKNIGVYVFAGISLLPLLVWRWHMNQHPEGMFSTLWLFNGGDIRFTGAFFRWLIFDRMNRLIFATGGFVLFWLGIIRGYEKKEHVFYYLWFLSVLIFFTVIAKGNVTHDYYQMPLVPIGCIFMAKGFDFLLSYGKTYLQRGINMSIAVILVLLMLAFGWYEVKGYFNINNPSIVKAGQAVDRLLPKDAKVIAPYFNDPAFLYQTNRIGWTVGDDRIEEFRKEGATHLVSVNYDDTTNKWIERCQVVAKDKEWVIISLTNCKS